MKKQIIVGLSGGVDSAVTAFLLQEQGYEVRAYFMRNWHEDDYCQADQDYQDARRVCDHLKIDCQLIDLSEAYWEEVFQDFLDNIAKGYTPNPDIFCNSKIKFKHFLTQTTAGKIPLATGHYARLVDRHDQKQLLTGLDPNKDQSYFLYRLSQTQLQSVHFPLGCLHKQQVRKIAQQAGLPVSKKKDSTGICFIGEKHFNSFLSRYLLNKSGPIISDQGKKLGEHQGLIFYTIGQRQGLGIGGQHAYSEAPWYVLSKRQEDNALVVGQGHDHPALYSKRCQIADLHWINGPPQENLPLHAKIRYRQQAQPCHILTIQGKEATVSFETNQRAITPGQHLVFYQHDVCLGGGVICAREHF